MAEIPIRTDIRVYLARNLNAARERGFNRPALVVVPETDNWNDFGNNFRADLHLVGLDAEIDPIRMRFMFPGANRTHRRVEALLGDRSRMRVSRLAEPFISILSSEGGYRDLVAHLGFDDAFSALRSMHDAVVARLEGVDEATIALSSSLDFHQSALRDDATWVAWRQGDRFLSPNRPADVDDAAQDFTVDVHLRGMQGRHRLDADFGQDFPLARRSLVLVGQNGTGKTRLFRAMIDGLTIDPPWEEGPVELEPIFAPEPRFSRLLVFSSVSSDPYPISIPPWMGLDYRYHRMTGPRPSAGDDLTLALLDCMRADGDVADLRHRSSMELFDEVLEPLDIKDDLFVEVREGAGDDALPNPLDFEGRHYFRLFQNRNEQRQLQFMSRIIADAAPRVIVGRRARDLSSGEQALVRFAAQAIASLRAGSLFLFDEPETHLHPNYISIFMGMLDRLLDMSGSIALIATHSAYVVREVPARRVRIVAKQGDDEAIQIDPPGMQTFGASIDTISQFVFGDISPKHRFQELLESWIDGQPEGVTIADVRERFGADLNAETMSYVAQLLRDRGAA